MDFLFSKNKFVSRNDVKGFTNVTPNYNACQDCTNTCSESCYTGCTGDCVTGCENTCIAGCSNSCQSLLLWSFVF
jgi:hypothetical protein